MKRLLPLFALAILIAGCNLKIEEWNSSKVLPLDVSLPVVNRTYLMTDFVNDNPRFLTIGGDTIYFAEDTTITNTYLAVDSTFNVTFSHGLPEILDSSQTTVSSRVMEITGVIKLKGNVVSPFHLQAVFSYYKEGTLERSDTLDIAFTSVGPIDTVINLTLSDIPIGPFSVNLKGTGSLGAVQADTLYLGYKIPSTLDLRGDTLVFDEISIKVDSAIIEAAQKGLIDTVQFSMFGGNRLPVGILVNTWVLNKEKTDSAKVFDVDFNPATVDDQGFAIGETTWAITAKLPRNVIDFLTRDTIYIHQSIIIPQMPNPVVVRSVDYIRYKGYMRVVGYLDFEKLSE
ncbi:MAG: hypothetical protein QMD82_03945 [bacterium]|nr:hypothetical protein [bacterium]